MIWKIGWVAPAWFEKKGWIHFFLQNCPWCKIASAARNWINPVPQTAAMKFVFFLSLSYFYDWMIQPHIYVYGLILNSKEKCVNLRKRLKEQRINPRWRCYEYNGEGVWRHGEGFMNTRWRCYEYKVKVLWIQSEGVMNTRWRCYEYKVKVLWIQDEGVMKTS